MTGFEPLDVSSEEDLSCRPIMTLKRRHQRIHDRLEYLLNRFFDGNPDAKAEYLASKQQRNDRWRAQDQKRPSRRGTSAPAPADQGSAPLRNRNGTYLKGEVHAAALDTASQPRMPTTASPSKDAHHSPLGELVGSTLGALKRRNRRRSDVRPGYFDPDRSSRGGQQKAGPEAGTMASSDALVMNIPTQEGSRLAGGNRESVMVPGAEGVGSPGSDKALMA